jgi:hypothetical protein
MLPSFAPKRSPPILVGGVRVSATTEEIRKKRFAVRLTGNCRGAFTQAP